MKKYGIILCLLLHWVGCGDDSGGSNSGAASDVGGSDVEVGVSDPLDSTIVVAQITEVEPRLVEPGSLVTLRGTGLASVSTVFLDGSIAVNPENVTDEVLQIRIPNDFAIINCGQSLRLSLSENSQNFVDIDIQPNKMTLTDVRFMVQLGSNMRFKYSGDRPSRVSIGSALLRAELTEQGDVSITLTDGIALGRQALRVESECRADILNYSIDVLAAPRIVEVTPTLVGAGEPIFVTVENVSPTELQAVTLDIYSLPLDDLDAIAWHPSPPRSAEMFAIRTPIDITQGKQHDLILVTSLGAEAKVSLRIANTEELEGTIPMLDSLAFAPPSAEFALWPIATTNYTEQVSMAIGSSKRWWHQLIEVGMCPATLSEPWKERGLLHEFDPPYPSSRNAAYRRVRPETPQGVNSRCMEITYDLSERRNLIRMDIFDSPDASGVNCTGQREETLFGGYGPKDICTGSVISPQKMTLFSKETGRRRSLYFRSIGGLGRCGSLLSEYSKNKGIQGTLIQLKGGENASCIRNDANLNSGLIDTVCREGDSVKFYLREPNTSAGDIQELELEIKQYPKDKALVDASISVVIDGIVYHSGSNNCSIQWENSEEFVVEDFSSENSTDIYHPREWLWYGRGSCRKPLINATGVGPETRSVVGYFHFALMLDSTISQSCSPQILVCDSIRNGNTSCLPTSCSDGRQDGNETGVDCGGSCPSCMVDIPAGRFQMGCVPADTSCLGNEQPRHEVVLDSFRIDRTEVTVGQYRACVDAGGCSEPRNSNPSCHWNDNSKNNHPINCVTWDQAGDYCAYAGKRMLSEAQWERAARSRNDHIYPWGMAVPSSDLAVYHPTNLRDVESVDISSLAVQANGLVGMSGNVGEFVEDCYDFDIYSSRTSTVVVSNPREDSCNFNDYKVVRGLPILSDLRVSARARWETQYSFSATWIGFRCGD